MIWIDNFGGLAINLFNILDTIVQSEDKKVEFQTVCWSYNWNHNYLLQIDMDNYNELHTHLKNTKLRLKIKNGWQEDDINAAINEYGRFLQLHKKQRTGIIVPGPMVDEVWHTHILHTRDYIKFCESEFGEYLHHDPKDYSTNETHDVAPTIKLYEETFGHKPPAKFWFGLPPETKVPKVTTTVISHGASCCRCG